MFGLAITLLIIELIRFIGNFLPPVDESDFDDGIIVCSRLISLVLTICGIVFFSIYINGAR